MPGINALFMDLYVGRAAMLNRLHLFFAIGALTVPLVVGLSVGWGAPWQAVAIASAAVAAPLAVLLGTRRLPPTHPRCQGRDRSRRATRRGPMRRDRRRLPAPAAGPGRSRSAATSRWSWACPAGSSVTSTDAPLEVATLALSLFWASLALGRLVSSFIVDRMGAVAFAATWSAACGVAILAAISVPSVPLAIACFAIAGFAAGPVYPMIMAIGGSLYPGRASMVSSVLASAAIVGSIVYPPLMGVVSEAAGMWFSMLGAALFAFAAAGCIWAAARLGREAGGCAPRQAVTA